jgi:hypothetical protein
MGKHANISPFSNHALLNHQVHSSGSCRMQKYRQSVTEQFLGCEPLSCQCEVFCLGCESLSPCTLYVDGKMLGGVGQMPDILHRPPVSSRPRSSTTSRSGPREASCWCFRATFSACLVQGLRQAVTELEDLLTQWRVRPPPSSHALSTLLTPPEGFPRTPHSKRGKKGGKNEGG